MTRSHKEFIIAFIYQDYVGPLTNNFRRNSRIFQLFKKKWAVLDHNHYHKELLFYANKMVLKDIKMKRFLNAIGVSYADLEDNDYDEIKRCWFWFNKYKQFEEAIAETLSAVSMADTLNSKIAIGDKVRVELTYGGSTQSYLQEHNEKWYISNINEISNYGFNSSEIFEKLHSDPWRYIANIIRDPENLGTMPFHMYDSGDVNLLSNAQPKGIKALRTNPATTTNVLTSNGVYEEESDISFFALALLDNDRTCFEPTLNEDGSVRIFKRRNTSYGSTPIVSDDELFDENGTLIITNKDEILDFGRLGMASGHTLEYEFTYKGAEENSGLIEKIKENLNLLTIRSRANNNVMDTLQKQKIRDLYQNTSGVEIQASYSKWEKYFTGDNLKIKETNEMKRYEFVNLLSDCLDTDYKAEGASWFEKVFAVVIIIVAVVLTLWSAGALGPATFGLAGLAQGLGYAALALTIGGMVLSQMGLSAASLVRMIGKVAQIVGIAASITGIMAAATSAFDRMAQEAFKAGTIQDVANYTISSFIGDVINNVFDKVTGNVLNVFKLMTDPFSVLFGTGDAIQLNTFGGWMDALQTGMKAHNMFMSNSADTETPVGPNDEQLEKTSFQHPEQMYELSEQMIYEPDALQKMTIMKDSQFGLSRTEKLLDQIA